MSVEMMAWALDQGDVGGTDKLVLIGIANHADKHGGNAYPSIETLARYASVKRRAVQRSIAVLVDAGHLSVVVNGAPDMRIPPDRRPNLYQIHVDRQSTGVSDGAPRGVSSETQRGVEPDQPQRPSGPDGVAHTTPKPSITVSEPSVNQTLVDVDEMFDRWWSQYPRRVGKKSARKSWDRITKRGTDLEAVEMLTTALRQWNDHWTKAKTEFNYLPHASTWLNDERYNDDPRPAKGYGPTSRRVDDDRDGPEGKVSNW